MNLYNQPQFFGNEVPYAQRCAMKDMNGDHRPHWTELATDY